ncbi:MAG: GyrI-like domain-containing protein [Bacteroidota bacterium]
MRTLLVLLSVAFVSSSKAQSEVITVEDFNIIGISMVTTNKKGQSIKDIGTLWQRFEKEQIAVRIPNIISGEVYSLFTDYESDFSGKYLTIIGFKVSHLDTIPDGMIGRAFKGGSYKKFIAKGEMPQAIAKTWQTIWSEDKSLKRRYTVDFEVYGPKSQKGKDSELDIYIAVE